MNFGIDRCQVRYLGKRQFKLYMKNSWVATNILERGPTVVVSMKITGQCSVKVKKNLSKTKLGELVGKRTKKHP